jgi:hypothetical protein
MGSKKPPVISGGNQEQTIFFSFYHNDKATFSLSRVVYVNTGLHPGLIEFKKEIKMKFPKELSTIFLILFLLAFGIGHFFLGALLNPTAAILAIVAAIFYLLGK